MMIAVVGAGIAGCACARVLVAAGHEVTVLDRGRVVGGRMASRRLPDRARSPRRTDTGASYFTVTGASFQAVVADWQRRGLARPWTDRFHTATPAGLGPVKVGPVRWAATGGLQTLVADLAAGLTVQHNREVRTVRGTAVDGQPYDAVVLAMPDPQALALLTPTSPAAAAITGRTWLPTLALAAGFTERCWDPELDGAFIHDSPVLTWVADDGRRRGDGAPVLVAHSTPEFARQYLAGPAAAGPEAIAALRSLLTLPRPVWTVVQRWSFARPATGRPEEFFLQDEVGLCGDGWGASKIEAAWQSGALLGAALVARFAAAPAVRGQQRSG